jgi:4-amino-4-deoxy-L-arabinose transferase-like glycosyltransferase
LGLRWLLILGITAALLVMGRPYFLYGEPSFGVFGDEGYYALRGWWVLKRILGEPMVFDQLNDVAQEFTGELYGRSGHVYAITLFYSLFGYSPAAVKGISALFGVLTGLLVYDLTRDLAGTRAARLACWLVWYWPSLMLWSVTNLKDPYTVFLMCLAVWAFHRWLAQRHLSLLVLAATALCAYATIKDYLWWVIVAAMALTWVLHLRPRTLRLGLVAAGLAMAWVLTTHAAWLDARLKQGIRTVAISHINFSREKAMSYRLLPDFYYEGVADHQPLQGRVGYHDLVRMVLLGTGYFLLVPLPWRVTSLPQALAVPQMLCWYGLLVAAAVGIWSMLRVQGRACCLTVSLLAALTVALSITGGNIGTAFRHRDLVTPLYLMFAAIGINELMRIGWRPLDNGRTP